MNERINLFPDMAPWEYEALKASIKIHKRLLVPVVKDEQGNIIDGHQRDRACRELGIKDYLVETLAGLTEEEKRDRAFILNCVRRSLNQQQKRDLIAAELKRTPDMSSNWLAQNLGMSDKTIEKIRRKLIATSEIPKFETYWGKDGKSRPATRVTTNTLNEEKRAQEAIRSLGEDAPRRPTELRLLERKASRKATVERLASESVPSPGHDAIRLYHCPFQRIEEVAGIEPNSVDLIPTDIPYGGDFLDQLPELAKIAERILVPGGLFATYSGQYHLDKVMKILGESLDYAWTISTQWNGEGTIINPRQVMSKWKRIVVFSKGPWNKRKLWYDVSRVPVKEKRWHPWQQPIDEVEKLIRDFSKPGDLIVDPCGGGFTTAVACQWLGDRRCISCDNDETAVSRGRERLAIEGIIDPCQVIREILQNNEDNGKSGDHVIEDWIMKCGRTGHAFRNYLRDLGPEWECRFKATLKDNGRSTSAD